MSVPGMNLLGLALGAIGHQPVVYSQYLSSTIDNKGRNIPQFAAPVGVPVGSVQAVPRGRYEQLGLSLSKEYVNWFVPRYVLGVCRDADGDRFNWRGEVWQVESTTDWSAQDGWCQCLSVRLGGADL